MNNQKKKVPTFWISVLPVILTIAILSFSILVLEIDIHIPLVIGAIIASLIAVLFLGAKWKDIEQGIIESIMSTMQAVLILAVVGSLIGSWIIGGIVPTLIYYGLQILSPTFFLLQVLIYLITSNTCFIQLLYLMELH